MKQLNNDLKIQIFMCTVHNSFKYKTLTLMSDEILYTLKTD